MDCVTIEMISNEIEMINNKKDVMCVHMEIDKQRTKMIDRQIETLKMKNMLQNVIVLKLNANIVSLK